MSTRQISMIIFRPARWRSEPPPPRRHLRPRSSTCIRLVVKGGRQRADAGAYEFGAAGPILSSHACRWPSQGEKSRALGKTGSSGQYSDQRVGFQVLSRRAPFRKDPGVLRTSCGDNPRIPCSRTPSYSAHGKRPSFRLLASVGGTISPNANRALLRARSSAGRCAA